MIESDVIIAIGDFASWGAGKELAWAERLRTPVLMLIRKGRSMSRLVTGTSGDIVMAEWRYPNDIREVWSTYFVKRRAQLEAHRRLRAGRRRIYANVAADPCRLRWPRRRGRTEVAAIAHLRPRRVEEILSTAGALAEASADELQALVNVLGLPSITAVPGSSPPSLPLRALSPLPPPPSLRGGRVGRRSSCCSVRRQNWRKAAPVGGPFNEPADWVDSNVAERIIGSGLADRGPPGPFIASPVRSRSTWNGSLMRWV